MGSSGDILVGSVEPPALNRRLADPRPSRASNSVAPVFLERAGGQDAHAPKRAERPRPQADGTPAHPGGRDAHAPRRTGRPRTQADGTPAHPGRRNARALRRAGCPRTQAGEMPAHPGGRDARAPRRLVTPAPRQVHAGAMPAASALGTRASGAHASEDAPPVRRRAVTLAPRPGSRRRNARAQRIPHAGRTPALPGRRDARAPRRARCPRSQAGEMPAHPGGRDARAPGGSCLNLQPRASRSSSRRSSQAHSSGVRRTSSATRLAANSSGVRHPTSA